MNALVLGAAGFLGINLVDALLAAGVTPRCARRKRTNVLALRQRKTPMVHAELDSVDELRAAMEGIDTVFHLAGHYPRHSLDREGAMATGTSQLENVLEACARAGVKRLVYVSSTATVRPRLQHAGASTEADVFPEAPGFGTYHDLKWQMEARVSKESRFEVVTACPAACLGPWDLRVGTSAMLVALARGLDVPHPDGIVSWVDARDVALALVRLAQSEKPPRRVLLSAGSMRLQELLELAASRYGVKAPPPMSDAQAIAFADAEERRALEQGGRAGLARELADLIIHGVTLDASLAREALGVTFRPLSETLAAFDEWARKVRILPSPQPQSQELSP